MPYEFKRSDVYGLASALGAETHERGEELFFRWCPYCKGGGHDKNTFSVNLENGTFKCFRAGCGAQGHLVQLARDFGYPLEFDDGRKKKYRTLPQRPVKVTNPAVRYLESRGISRAKEDLCASSAIRVKPGGKGAPWVVEKTEFSEPDTYTPPSDI